MIQSLLHFPLSLAIGEALAFAFLNNRLHESTWYENRFTSTVRNIECSGAILKHILRKWYIQSP
jgi:hypothetical protein